MSGVEGIDGLEALADALRRVDLTDDLAEPAFDAIAAQYRRRRAEIPRDSGDLADSLTRRRDRNHYEDIKGGRIAFGSKLRYARKQSRRLPRLNPAPIVRALQTALLAHLTKQARRR